MADVRPFRALQYQAAAGPLSELVAPPYDVISPEERRGFLATSPYNAVRLILPEVDYEEVGGLIERWREEGALGVADRPRLVGWTQEFDLGDGTRRVRHTIMAAVGLEPYERRVIRPHERTHAGPKADRLRLMRAVRANLSPVFGLYPDPAGEAWSALGTDAAEPDAEFTDHEGTVHRLWSVDDPAACAGVAEAMRDRWILIADGHHRYETSLAYRDERRAEGGDPEAPFNRVMMGLTSLDDPGLAVLPTHRVLTRWPDGAEDGFDSRPVDGVDELLAALAETPPDAPAFGLARPDGLRLLTGPPEADPSPAARLDVAVLERRILVPHLGADQATLTADGVLSYVKDARDAVGLVSAGRAAAAVVQRPIPKADVAAVAEAAETMPQKSTYFFPKLLTGVAFHPLVDA